MIFIPWMALNSCLPCQALNYYIMLLDQHFDGLSESMDLVLAGCNFG
jgi:hypothetical protein